MLDQIAKFWGAEGGWDESPPRCATLGSSFSCTCPNSEWSSLPSCKPTPNVSGCESAEFLDGACV